MLVRAAAPQREAPARGASNEAHSSDAARIPRGHELPSLCKLQPQTRNTQGSDSMEFEMSCIFGKVLGASVWGLAQEET